MRRSALVVVAAALCLTVGLMAGCDSLTGKTKEADRPINPSQVKDFAELYGQNCSE